MASMAVQYEGYVSTVEFPFVVGRHARGEGKALIDALVEAEAVGLEHLKPGEPQRELVRAVRDSFRTKSLGKYDVYPPLHGCGLAEAESPYPDENTQAVFQPGMTVNTDISLFGLPVGANRIEEGFVIMETGAESMSPLVRRLTRQWLAS
jgi:Xaa-Pro aminopeptidase